MERIPVPERSTGAEVLLYGAVCLMLLPVRWVIAVAAAGAVHEVCHILAIRLQRVRIHSLRIGLSGAVICTEPMNERQELLSAAAGPLGSLCMIALANLWPELAFCGLVHGLFNLFPLYPSDGGRILSCVLQLCCPERADLLLRWTERAVLFLLLFGAIGLIVLFPRWFWVILTGALLILRSAFRKIPCKADSLAVQ